MKIIGNRGTEPLFIKDFQVKREDNQNRVPPDLIKRCRIRLTALKEAERLEDLNIPGFDLHSLKGKPKRYTIHVNGPWCITFEWLDGDVWRVDLVQYY